MKKTLITLALELFMIFALNTGYSEKSSPIKQQMETYVVSCNLP